MRQIYELLKGLDIDVEAILEDLQTQALLLTANQSNWKQPFEQPVISFIIYPSNIFACSDTMDNPPFEIVGNDRGNYFRVFENRSLNTLCAAYMLPVDEEEIRVCHRFCTQARV